MISLATASKVLARALSLAVNGGIHAFGKRFLGVVALDARPRETSRDIGRASSFCSASKRSLKCQSFDPVVVTSMTIATVGSLAVFFVRLQVPKVGVVPGRHGFDSPKIAIPTRPRSTNNNTNKLAG